MSNPFTSSTAIPSGKGIVLLHGVTNARNIQRLTITIHNNPLGSPNVIIFQGRGENATPMSITIDGVPQDETIVKIDGYTGEFTRSVLCEYSSDDGKTWLENSPNNVQGSHTSTPRAYFDTLETEDWIDGDFNDAFLSTVIIGTGTN